VEVIEDYMIGNMGHGTPIDALPADNGEAAGPYMLDVGISSTRRIIAFWGLERARQPKPVAATRPAVEPVPIAPRYVPDPVPPAPPPQGPTSKVQDIIEKALRSAGLMK
jgi:hypothetical protein